MSDWNKSLFLEPSTTMYRIKGLICISLLVSFTLANSNENSWIDNGIEMFSMASGYFGSMNLGLTSMSKTEEIVEPEVNPDIFLTTPELIKKYGFPVETHNVFTDDDYVLTLHRIPHGRHNDSKMVFNETRSKKPVVFLQHGLCSSSVDWIMNTADKALPYMLADRGFDVWLGNSRGNNYSRRHITMTPKKPSYWDFSWNEMGIYDIPAVIDYILKLTGQEDLSYVGHSMGTTMFFVAMASKPEYNAKIRKMIALGPAVHLEDMKSPLRYLAPLSGFEKFLLDLFGKGVLLPQPLLKYMHTFAGSACQEESFTSGVCENIMYVIGGFNPSQTNETQLPVILGHSPSTCSTKSGIHFLQSVSSGKFRHYDYGTIGNVLRYSQTKPPVYNLTEVTAPVALFYAQDDVLCDPKGVERLADELPNLLGSYKIDYPKFTHIDFIFAKDADKILYNDVIKILGD